MSENIMTSQDLSNRNPIWVMDAAEAGKTGECTVVDLLEYLPKEDYTVEIKTAKCKVRKPTKGSYVLDIKITCIKTKLSIFIEVKKQNARGNAHERAYKYLPNGGIAQYIRTKYNWNYYPVITIFTGEMTLKAKYINEIEMQYGITKGAVFLFNGNIDAFVLFVNEEFCPA